MTVRLFYDSEFTGLHQRSTLISVGFCTEADDGPEFYAEFSDYDASQCDDWIRRNVLAHTRWIAAGAGAPMTAREGNLTTAFGDRAQVAGWLLRWLGQFDAAEVWADCLAYDWVLLCELFGGALSLPKPLFWMPFDLATAFKLRGLDPDTDREAFAGQAVAGEGARHNALHDAQVARACYQRLFPE